MDSFTNLREFKLFVYLEESFIISRNSNYLINTIAIWLFYLIVIYILKQFYNNKRFDFELFLFLSSIHLSKQFFSFLISLRNEFIEVVYLDFAWRFFKSIQNQNVVSSVINISDSGRIGYKIIETKRLFDHMSFKNNNNNKGGSLCVLHV